MERVGAEGFDGERWRKPGRWAVCFAADWCPYCARFLRRFTSFRPPDGVALAIVDLTDLDNPLWDRFSVDIVPTLAMFVDGQLAWRRDGRAGYGLDATSLADLERASRCPEREGGGRRGPPYGTRTL